MNKLIKQLLAVPESQLLRHEKVVAAAEGLGVPLIVQRVPHNYKWARSMADVAEEMRDACAEKDLPWILKLGEVTGTHIANYNLFKAAAKQRIIAATLAWWEGQGS